VIKIHDPEITKLIRVQSTNTKVVLLELAFWLCHPNTVALLPYF